MHGDSEYMDDDGSIMILTHLAHILRDKLSTHACMHSTLPILLY